MKKFAPILLPVAFLLASVLPQAVLAAADITCSDGVTLTCPNANYTCTVDTHECVPISGGSTTGTTGSGSGALNTTLLRAYATSIISFINDVAVPLLAAIAFIYFIWGVFKFFILGAESEEERKTGRTFVMYAVVGFVVIFSLWGLVNVGASILNLGGSRQFNGLNYPTL